eukprot:2328421-Pyramimonas_sp.AAC.1
MGSSWARWSAQPFFPRLRLHGAPDLHVRRRRRLLGRAAERRPPPSQAAAGHGPREAPSEGPPTRAFL